MVGKVVLDAPQPGVLRHRQDQPAVGLECLAQFRQHQQVFVDVFQDVKSPNHIEGSRKGDAARVHLKQLGAWSPLCSEVQAFHEYFASAHIQCRMGGRDRGKNKSGSAADFEIAACFREVFTESIEYQCIAGLKPETSSFERGEHVVMVRIVARGFFREFRRVSNESVDHLGLVSASGTLPCRSRQPTPWTNIHSSPINATPTTISPTPSNFITDKGSANNQAPTTTTRTKATAVKG